MARLTVNVPAYRFLLLEGGQSRVIALNANDYQVSVGDELQLWEVNFSDEFIYQPTGREIVRTVGYVNYSLPGMAKGWVVVEINR